MEQVYIMVTIDLVTNRSYIIPMKYSFAKSLIRAQETLQGLRGCVSTIIIDKTKSHQVLKREQTSGLVDLLLRTKTILLV